MRASSLRLGLLGLLAAASLAACGKKGTGTDSAAMASAVDSMLAPRARADSARGAAAADTAGAPGRTPSSADSARTRDTSRAPASSRPR